MALVACKQCKAQISSDAAVCPQCGAKQNRTSPLIWVVVAVVVLWVGKIAIDSAGETRRASSPVSERAAAMLKEQQAAVREELRRKLAETCTAERPAKVAQYQALVAKRLFDAAWSTIKDCAEATGDTELRKLADTARIADLKNTANSANHMAGARMAALDALQREYPQEFDKKAEQLYSSVLKLKAAEIAAEKRRQGVSIGMSQQDVLASSWGRPDHVNRDTYSWGTLEQWVYPGGNYLYFKDGVLASVSTSGSR